MLVCDSVWKIVFGVEKVHAMLSLFHFHFIFLFNFSFSFTSETHQFDICGMGHLYLRFCGVECSCPSMRQYWNACILMFARSIHLSKFLVPHLKIFQIWNVERYHSCLSIVICSFRFWNCDCHVVSSFVSVY